MLLAEFCEKLRYISPRPVYIILCGLLTFGPSAVAYHRGLPVLLRADREGTSGSSVTPRTHQLQTQHWSSRRRKCCGPLGRSSCLIKGGDRNLPRVWKGVGPADGLHGIRSSPNAHLLSFLLRLCYTDRSRKFPETPGIWVGCFVCNLSGKLDVAWANS